MEIRLVYEYATIGGTETLCLRVAKWFKDRKCDVKLYCYDIEDELYHQFTLLGCEIHIVSSKKKLGTYSVKHNFSSENIIITFFPFVFIDAEYENSKHKRSCKVFWYVLHPKLLIMNSRYKIVNSVYSKFNYKIIDKYACNGNVLFMDPLCIDYFEKYYGVKRENLYGIVSIPYEFDNLDSKVIYEKSRMRKDNFNILTVSRCDFPFKDYLYGLVDYYEKLSKKYSEISLTMILSGKNKDDICDYIKNKRLQNNIKVFNNLEYDQLPKYYKAASLYIGMGSTLIEASAYGTISIPVLPYTKQLYANDYFLKKPLCNIATKVSENNIDNIVDQIILSDDESFEKLCNESYRVIRSTYSMENFYNAINKNIDFSYHYIPKIANILSNIFFLKHRLLNDRGKNKIC